MSASSIPILCYIKTVTSLFQPLHTILSDSAFPFPISCSASLCINHILLCPPGHRSPFLLAQIHQSFSSLLCSQWFILSCSRQPTPFCRFHDCYLQFWFCPSLKSFISSHWPCLLDPSSQQLSISVAPWHLLHTIDCVAICLSFFFFFQKQFWYSDHSFYFLTVFLRMFQLCNLALAASTLSLYCASQSSLFWTSDDSEVQYKLSVDRAVSLHLLSTLLTAPLLCPNLHYTYTLSWS